MTTRLSIVAGVTDPPLLEMTIGDNLDATVREHPDREALVDVPSGRRWTYAQLLADVEAVARGLLADGVEVGDRIGIWAPNVPEWMILQYATAKIGAILVSINPGYRAQELEYALNQSGISMLVTMTRFKTSDYASMVEQVRPGCPGLRRVVFCDTVDWGALVDRAREVPADLLVRVPAKLEPHDPINIQYTSGTTGLPKGATLSHHNILNNGFFVGELVRYTHEDRICVPVPFYHCFGMVMGNLGATSHGACVVLPAPSFDPVATLATIQSERCTSVYGVPTMFIGMLGVEDFASYDLGSVRTGIMAGSPCPIEVMRQVAEWAPEVAIAYGMTETSPASTQTTVDDSLERRVSTVGRVHPHVHAKIIDPDTGEVVPRGRGGELCNRGYSVMLGYWDEPAKTAEAVDEDGWIHTGDLAVMDGDGYISITGRIKDLVIRGGQNVYPREIEEFLHTHPDVVDAQVIGVPDEVYGEELMVWLRMRAGADPLEADALRAFCTGRLARYKIPRYVHCVEEYPMTVTGKVRKVEMREQAVQLLEGGRR